MSDDRITDGVRRRMRARVRKSTVDTDGPNILRRLGLADYFSMGALFWGWVSTLLFVAGETNLAVVAMLGAYAFDKLDGFVARQFDSTSELGLQVDSYIDIFTYLVPGALLFHVGVGPHPVVGAVVGFLVLGFGGLRLIRHRSEGFGEEDGTSYYHGITVVHVNVLIVTAYFLARFGPRYAPVWDGAVFGYAAGAVVALASPLMISDYKSYKTDVGHAVVALGGLIAAALALYLEYLAPA